MPETLNGAGVLFHEKRWDDIAEMMGRMTKDDDLRASIILKQQERLRRYKSRDLADELKRILLPLLPA